MREYDHNIIEEKWEEQWEKEGTYHTPEDPKQKKSYVLDMFPYPSGEGLHAGHTRIYTASDVYARLKRMQGYAVLHPTGWDAFGLPAEQYAIKNKVHPSSSVEKNTARFRSQMKRLALSYDWDREINTTDPAFYKWTQWIFLQMFKKGLAYESFEPINWCPTCETGLANEDLENGNCERCGTPVVKKPMRQWVLRITEYADRLLDDIELLEKWPESYKDSERNWIGRSVGGEFEFPLVIEGQPDGKDKVTIFTTRPDTLCGATYVAISAELAGKWKNAGWTPSANVDAFITKLLKEEAVRAYGVIPEKEGMFTGIYAINPVTKAKVPVWIANYVLSGYGTGAIMAVPAHDERDYDFAEKYSLPIITVIDAEHNEKCYTGEGVLVNSGEWNGLKNTEAATKITERFGKHKVEYKLRDWVFSRQRYWGEPIPIIHCASCGAVPVPESELPVTLPQVESYAPSGTGESPLANIAEWVNTTCPTCGKPGKRETNTMPQWAGSSWYYLRYIDPKNVEELIASTEEIKWNPVDVYVGGAEHVTRHLIYARFWHKFLFDIKVVTHPEPFTRLEIVGLVLGENGVKMSKRLGNVINPDDMVDRFGADSLRIYEMFMGPFGQQIAWSTDNLVGARRFVERIWRLQEHISDTATIDEQLLHFTIKKVGEDIERFAFNTAISQLMILLNAIDKTGSIHPDVWSVLLRLIAPFAPYIAEELWHDLGNSDSIHHASWPEYVPEKLISSAVTIAVQIGGKMRGTVTVERDAKESVVVAKATEDETIAKWFVGKNIVRTILIPNKILNVIVKE